MLKDFWKKLANEFKFSGFEWSLLIGMFLACIGYGIFNPFNDTPLAMVLNIISSLSGVICVVLCAKGKVSTYFWGVINIVAYVIICFQYMLWGDLGLNALIFLPTQIIGWITWNKHINKDVEEVKAKKMTWKQWIVWGLLAAVTAVGLGYLLANVLPTLNGSAAWLDGAMTILSVWANVLMVKRYSEQWPLWIVVDVVAVVKWLMVGNIVMAAMYAIYLINAVYGYVNWLKMNRVSNTINE